MSRACRRGNIPIWDFIQGKRLVCYFRQRLYRFISTTKYIIATKMTEYKLVIVGGGGTTNK